ncbi:MAG TPA: hypothetical protein DEP18_05145, partial [Flavobacteriales bacterium]|nr:hypothetical protein [Flavobacteriales bacterium]
MMKKISYSGLLIAFVVLFTNVNAGHLEFSNRIFSVPAVSNILVTDQLEIEVNPKTGSFTDYKVSNILTLGVDHHYSEFFATAMEVKVKFSLSQYNSANSLVGTSSKYLTIKYDPFGGAYQDKSSFLFSNAYRFVAEIDSIYVNGVPKDSLPGLLFVEGYTNIDRFYNFSSAATTPIVLNALTTSEVDCDGADDHITVSWPAVTGAEEYHLEWSFVNDYNDSLTFKPASALTLDFRNNATRVSTKAENYTIPLLFEHGYLAFRVRPVGRDHSSPDNYIFGVWSLPEKVKASDLDTSVVHVIFPHEANKNWQVTTTFAEEGKKKEVISYFDGTLRNRQTVTRINSDNHIIVGQTIYDHQGRPAVTVLPVPVQDSVCDNSFVDHSLKYYPNFNLDDTLNLYGRNDFDLDDPDSACAANAAPMSVTSGSSNYYSNDNPNQNGYQSYVPNSEKYPLVQVEYTPDNTGRIRRQGGVGPEFQLGSGHETFYYYGQPNQIQLDRLFGSEAGDAAHYKKNVVIDPNGQASVSYLDQEGRVIATSLAGDTTQNLLALDSENGAAVQLTIDLFSKNSNGVSNTNVVTQDSTGIKFSTQLLVAYSSNFEFNYSIEVDTVDDACLKDNICFHCVYDLVISIHDECMQLVYSTDTIIGHFTMEDTLIVFDTLCTDPTALNFDRNFTLALEPGNYTVYKHLRINEAAMEHYLNLYLDTTYNSCFKTLAEFQEEYLSNIDSASCQISCESCIEALGDRDEFVASGNGTAFEWDRRYEECRLMCTDTEEPCEAELMMMLGDVSPNGQYGQYLTGSGSISPTSFPLSVFNQTNKLPESWNTPGQAYWRKPKIELNETVYPYYVDEDNQRSKVYIVPNGNNYIPAVSDTSSAYVFTDNQGGKYTWPENLSDVADFIDLWKTSWSRSLVYLHPEICYYQTCLSYSEKAIDTNSFSSHSFDVLLRNTNSFYQAKNAGLIKSNYASFPDPNDRVTDWFINQSGTTIAWDPFVVYNTGYGPALEQVFDTYVTYGGNSYSMVEIAALTARCGGLTGINPSGTCLLFGSDMYPGGPAALNDSIRNLEWNNLRSFYLSKKLIMQSNYADNIALNDCEAVNDCIGNQNFNAVESGMFSGGGFTNSPWFDGSQPCSVHNYQYYLNKISRFPDPSDMEHIVGSSDVHDVNYQHYLQTGQCPLAVHMQEMLGALAHADVLDSTDIQMMQFPGFSTWFLDFSGYSVNSSINTFDLYWNTTSAGNTISITLTNGSGGAAICTGALVKDTSIASWDDISFFTGIQYTHSISNQHYFTMQAAIPNHPDSLLPFSFYTVTGNTCRNIGDCKFPQECRPTDLAVDLERLISVIALDQELDASSLNIETDYSLLITPRIRAALGTPNSDLRWNWDLSTHSFQLYDQSSPSRKIVIQISDVLPATFNFYNLDSIRGVSGLNGTYEHYFVMNGTDTSGLEIVQFNGKIFLEEPSDSSQIFLGDCGRREPMACREMPYQTRTDLSKLMKDVLLNQHPDSINLFSSIYMTDVLLSYYPDTNSHSTSNYIEYTSPGDTLFADTLRIVMDNCLVELYHDDDNDPSLPMDSLIGVGDLVAYGDPSDDGNYYSFLIPVTYSISNTTYTDTLYGTSCFPLKNCVPCPQEQEEMEMMMMMVGGSSMNEEEINNALGQLFNLTENTPYTDSIAALFGLVYDPTYANYSGYVHEINELNARNSWSSSDSLFVTPVSYEEFALRGYAAMNESYKRYIHHYIHGLDSYEWLNNPVKFALGYGTGYNVNAEYQRYFAAVTRYNERAEAEGISDISTMNVSTYRTEKYAERTAEYVDYIESYPQSGNPGDGIYEYYNSGFMMMAMSYPDSCDSLYQIYLAAYTDFENYQALHPTCLDYQEIAPLYGYYNFEWNNLCCSDTGLALILDYIATLQDTMQCPGPLPYLATCDTVPDSTCFILYMQYLDDIDEYNESDYAAWADDSIINPYPTFESFVRSGLCSCQDQYHEYIAPYLNSPADTTLALPQSIDEFAPCLNSFALDKSPCGDNAYRKYLNAVGKYNSWADANPGSGWPIITSILASNQFTPARYCYCVDAYVAFLKSIEEGMIPYSSSLLYKLSLIEGCNNKITAECTPTQTITNIPPSPTVDPGNPCLDYLVDMALFNAQNAYNQYTDSLANAFRNK